MAYYTILSATYTVPINFCQQRNNFGRNDVLFIYIFYGIFRYKRHLYFSNVYENLKQNYFMD